MNKKISRRDLLKKSSISLLGGSFLLTGAEEKAFADAVGKGIPAIPADRKQSMETGKIGDLELSRMILGGNLIGGWAHARDLIYVSKLFKAYNTREKIMETLQLAEANGINSVLVTATEMDYINDYNREYGGKMKTMCQITSRKEDPFEEVDMAFEYGADTMYIQGAFADRFVSAGKMDDLVSLLERIQMTGCPGGVGAHALTVIQECERLGVETDYYVKTLHPDTYWSAHSRENRFEFEVDAKRFDDHDRFHDNIFDLRPEETIAFMNSVEKPWVAFKVMAAGAVPPREAFQFAYDNGADFIAAGMFDFQVEEDVRYANAALAGSKQRQRKWWA